MAQFDVYENINTNNDEIPYLLDIQHKILTTFNTRVVIPLAINEKTTQIINPLITINDKEFIMLTTQLAGIPINRLGKKVCSLSSSRSKIIDAVDFIITGY
ncbi:MAG: CcdB family protein [Arcobacteraceae bacterium]|nr:CcdB family protein [Arcobacteraceae bacterium]